MESSWYLNCNFCYEFTANIGNPQFELSVISEAYAYQEISGILLLVWIGYGMISGGAFMPPGGEAR